MSGSSTNPPPFRGVEVTLAGVVYVMPALGFGGLDQCKTAMMQIDQGQLGEPDLRAAFTQVLLAALQRNYPDMQATTLQAALDWPTAVQMYHRLMEISFPQPAAGETTVVSPSGASTGN